MINLIDEAIEALENASKRENAVLYMSHYIWENNECDTAACICGYMALERGYGEFEAREIAIDFNIKCDEIFNNKYLSRSIYDGSPHIREAYAIQSKLFTEEELQHPHLTTESSIEDAISYLKLCREKVIEHG